MLLVIKGNELPVYSKTAFLIGQWDGVGWGSTLKVSIQIEEQEKQAVERLLDLRGWGQTEAGLG